MGWDSTWCACCCCCKRTPTTVEATEAPEKPKRKIFDRLFSQYYAPFLVRPRVKWIILVASVSVVVRKVNISMGLIDWQVVGVVFAAMTKPEEEPLQMFKEGHPLRDVFGLQDDFAAMSEDFVVQSHVVWGIKGLDQSTGDKEDYNKPGTVIWEEDFDVTRADTQEAILDMCLEAPQQEKLHIIPTDQVLTGYFV